MSVRQAIKDVTDRIATRSAESRAAYLDRVAAAKEAGVNRSVLSCGNLAHGFAACSPTDKARLAGNKALNLGIVNAYNDNPDYFYIKKADASRVYGLELEHLLSPNRLNFLTHGTTLVEEHIAGIPGDIFIDRWLNRPELRPIRIAKELVKFNERSFVQLLGDMRSYNFVVVITPDFEGSQVRIRAMDFDQQAHNGRKTFYLPQFFKENLPLVEFCMKHLHLKTAFQYQREEQTLMLARAELAASRLALLLAVMERDLIAPEENVRTLREGLAEHFKNDRYLRCESMGALVRENLEMLRTNIHQGLGALKADQILPSLVRR